MINDGDNIIVDLNQNTLTCLELEDEVIFAERMKSWQKEVDQNGGNHPSVGEIDTRLLNNMRCNAVSAVYGAGMHPNRSLWVSSPRSVERSGFEPSNKYRK